MFRIRVWRFTEEVVCTGPGTGGSVTRIEETAAIKRETAAADAPGQFVPQRLEFSDAAVQQTAPRLRQPLPVVAVWGPRLWELVERPPYLLEGESEYLSGADDRNASQVFSGIPALAASRSLRRDQPALLIVTERGCPKPRFEMPSRRS